MVESDLSEIPSEVIRAALSETVENKLKTKNFKINVSSASQAGANNFIGIVYRVSFSKQDEENDKPPSKLILKVAPQNEARRSEFFSRPCFLREIYMYNEVILFLNKIIEFSKTNQKLFREFFFINFVLFITCFKKPCALRFYHFCVNSKSQKA